MRAIKVKAIFLFSLCALLCIAPFSYVKADDFNYDFETFDIDYTRWFAYDYFLQNGFNKGISNEISIESNVLKELVGDSVPINTNFPTYTIRWPGFHLNGTSYSSNIDTSGYYAVYDGNTYLGYFAGFYTAPQGSNNQVNALMYYTNASSGVKTAVCNSINCRLEFIDSGNNSQSTDYSNFVISPGTLSSTITPSSSSSSYNLDLNFDEQYKLLSYLYTYAQNMGISGTYTGPTAYTVSQRYSINAGETIDLLFFIRGYNQAFNNVSLYGEGSEYITLEFGRKFVGSNQLARISFTNTNIATSYFSFAIEQLRNRTITVIPIYFYSRDKMPDEMYQFYFGNKYIPYINQVINLENTQIANQLTQITNQQTQITNQNTIISRLQDLITNMTSGNQESNSAVNSQSQTNSQFDQQASALEDLEENAIDNMDSNLESTFNTNNTVLNEAGFIRSARWVRARFDNLIDNELGFVIGIFLLLGIASIFIGRNK